jgi:hypothetical protein
MEAVEETPMEAGEETTVDQTTDEETTDAPPGAMMWQLSFPMGEAEAKELCSDPAKLIAEAVKRCGEWPSPVPELLAATLPGNAAGYPAYDRDCLGKAVHVDLTTPPFKAPGTKRVKLQYDTLLSNFGLKFNLRRYTLTRPT